MPVLNVHWDNLQVLMSERGKAKTLKLYENALYKYRLIITKQKYVYIMFIYLFNYDALPIWKNRENIVIHELLL
jgi:hypothetical protein